MNIQTLNRAARRAQGIKPAHRQVSHCHKLIADTAKGLAQVLWEELMKNDKVWAQHREAHPGLTTGQMERKFVDKMWPQLLAQARATLAAMLAPGSTISDDMKEDIMDALTRDRTLMDTSGKRKSHQVLGHK